MDKLQRLANWKSVAVGAARAAGRDGVNELEKVTFKSEDDLFAFFDCFRPDGDGLETVFAGVVGGEEILLRIRRIYALKETETAFGYFVIRRPIPSSHDELLDLTERHYLNVRQIAHPMNDSLLASELEVLPEIKIKREAIPTRNYSAYSNSPEAVINDATGDWFHDLAPLQSDALLLNEAFYSIARDYNIAHYLMWPLYRSGTEIDEPFKPYFELWMRGASPFFEKPGLVSVYVPFGQ